MVLLYYTTRDLRLHSCRRESIDLHNCEEVRQSAPGRSHKSAVGRLYIKFVDILNGHSSRALSPNPIDNHYHLHLQITELKEDTLIPHDTRLHIPPHYLTCSGFLTTVVQSLPYKVTSIVVFLSEADANEDERVAEDDFSEADEGIHCSPLMSPMICSGVSSTSRLPPIGPAPHVI